MSKANVARASHVPNTGCCDLHTLTHEVVHQISEYTQIGTRPWDYNTALFDLPVQVGSLLKLVMQSRGERYCHGLSNKEIRAKIGDELCDILSHVLFIAHELNIDLKDAWEKMIASDQEKFRTRSAGREHS